MKRLQQTIECFSPRTALQKYSKEHLQDAIEIYGADLLDRSLEHGHLTASAIVLNSACDHVLMAHHKLFDSYGWLGGHSDGDADLLHVACKELTEETGISKFYPVLRAPISIEILDVRAHERRGVPVAKHIHYNVTFGFIASMKERLEVNAQENLAVKWIPIDELESYCTEAHMLPIYRDNIQQIKHLMSEKRKRYESLPAYLLPWYQENARILPWRQTKEPYAIWISEIMLQQTRVEAVVDYFYRFMALFPTVQSLATAQEDQVLKCWEGLGYYSRARNLHRAARVIVEQYGGMFPREKEQIEQLPGIGPYTAGAIASIAFDERCAAVDGNVLRVCTRLTEDWRNIDDASTKKSIAQLLERIYPADAGDFTQALMEIGALVCVPNGEPNCTHCPVERICVAKENQTAMLLPVRNEKKERKHQSITMILMEYQGEIALQRREAKGVLKGLWGFPHVEENLTWKEVETMLIQKGAEIRSVEALNGKHIFTHIQWDITCYHVICSQRPESYIWANTEQLQNQYTLPQAFKKFLNQIELGKE